MGEVSVLPWILSGCWQWCGTVYVPLAGFFVWILLACHLHWLALVHLVDVKLIVCRCETVPRCSYTFTKNAVYGKLGLSRWFYIQKCRMAACSSTSWQAAVCCVCALWVHGMCSFGLVQCQHTCRLFTLLCRQLVARCYGCTFSDVMLLSQLLVIGTLRQSNEHGAVAYNHILCGLCKMALYYRGAATLLQWLFFAKFHQNCKDFN